MFEMALNIRSRMIGQFRFLEKHAKVIGTSFRRTATVVNDLPKPNYLKNILIGGGAGAVVGGAYVYYKVVQNPASQVVSPTQIRHPPALAKLPDIQVSRKIVVPTDTSGLKLTLFQYPTCPFCCKVRAFLDYYGISYDVVEVNPVLRQQIKWSKYKKVPILLAGVNENEYIQLNDSTMIVSSLMTYLKDGNTSVLEIRDKYPVIQHDSDGKKIEIMNRYFVMGGNTDEASLQLEKDERKWRTWADEVLVHTLSPNVYRTKEEALQSFNWFSEVGEWERLFSKWERLLIIYVGAYAMIFVGNRLKKRHNLKGDVRISLYDECNVWMNAVKKQGNFLGGAKPNLADLAVYGVLSSIEGCLAFQDVLDNTNIGDWYFKMKEAVTNHEGALTLKN